MGILRTDTISGLETPTPVTGSVSFDGSGDRLQIENNDNFNFPGDFTIECWVYSITPLENYAIEYAHIAGKGNGIVASTYSLAFYQSKATFLKSTSGGSYSFITGTSILSNSVWYHFAVTRQSNVLKIFVNGILESSTTVSDNLTNSYSFNIGDRQSGDGSSQYPLNGYISNLRILKGTALYTSNFTPPTRELQPIGDTVLLCCNNPDSAGAEATGKTITVNGDAVASTFSPGLTRDFTYGTQFDGVSRFDTQGYFVPPSGTTEQRGAGNAIFAGGYIGPAATNVIEYMNLNSSGSQRDFGDLKGGAYAPSVTSSSTRALIAGGYISPAIITNIDYVTLSSSGMNALDFGDLTIQRRDFSGCSNNTRSIFGGGTTTGSTSITASMEYMTSASLGSVASFGDLLSTGRGNASCSSPTRGIFFGGYQAFATPVSTYTNAINYITIATTGSAADFGDLVIDNNGKKGGHAAFSNSTRGVVGGGAAYFSPAYTVYNTIEYITITSTGNAQDFGDLIQARNYLSGTSNSVRGFFTQGSTPTYVNTCEFVTIASTGNAQDFGDFVNATYTYDNAGSDSHGGLS
jgi:hypothetical protein